MGDLRHTSNLQTLHVRAASDFDRLLHSPPIGESSPGRTTPSRRPHATADPHARVAVFEIWLRSSRLSTADRQSAAIAAHAFPRTVRAAPWRYQLKFRVGRVVCGRAQAMKRRLTCLRSCSYVKDSWVLVRWMSSPPPPKCMACLTTSATRRSPAAPSQDLSLAVPVGCACAWQTIHPWWLVVCCWCLCGCGAAGVGRVMF